MRSNQDLFHLLMNIIKLQGKIPMLRFSLISLTTMQFAKL